MRIEYYEENSRIGVKYAIDFEGEEWETYLKEEVKTPTGRARHFETDLGFIPKKIQKQGAEVVRRHAEEICRAHMEQRKQVVLHKEQSREERMKNTNHPITATHPDGTRLKGRIAYHSPGSVVAKLEEPFETDHGAFFDYPNCWAASMAGMRVFNQEDGSLTKRVIDDAYWALTHLYDKAIRRQKHEKATGLVDELNKGEIGIVQTLANGEQVMRTTIRGLDLIALDPKKK